MKRKSFLRYALELIVILGFLVIGVAILTYIFQNVPMDRVFIGYIILSSGVIELTDYFTWKYATRIKSVQSLIASLAAIALGIVFMAVKLDIQLVCILFGAFGIAFAIATIITAALNLTRQPLLNGIKIILSIVGLVFSILLIIRTTYSLYSHMLYIGIALVVKAFVLLIEYMVHRYQGYRA